MAKSDFPTQRLILNYNAFLFDCKFITRVKFKLYGAFDFPQHFQPSFSDMQENYERRLVKQFNVNQFVR